MTSRRRSCGVVGALLALALGATACAQQEPTASRSSAAPDRTAVPSPSGTSPASASPAGSAQPTPEPTPEPGPTEVDHAPLPRSLSVSDPVGDLDGSRLDHWFAPSVDLTGFEATYLPASRTMELRLSFLDLRETERDGDRIEESIYISNVDAGRRIGFTRADGGTSQISVQVVAGLSHFGSTTEECVGGTSVVSLRSDTVLLSLPFDCVASQHGPVRFSVDVSGNQVLRARSGPILASDHLETGRVATR